MPPPLPVPLKPASSRDGRIDFVRGVCLIDMVLVHLIVWGVDPGRQTALWLGEYVRFAAGGFVVMSGLTIAVVAQAKLERGWDWRGLTKWLWYRAAFVLAMHYAATLAFALLFPLDGTTKLMPPVPVFLTETLLLRSGSDLLPFYVVMLLVTPAIVLAARSRAGAAAVALASVALFAWANAGENFKTFPLPLQHVFFIPLWQMMFVIGLLAGRAWPAYVTLDLRVRKMLTSAAWLAVAALTVMAYGEWWGIPLAPPIAFWKNPLTAGEALRYLSWTAALLLSADLAAGAIDRSRLANVMQQLGRKSLELYVAHVFLAAGVIFIDRKLDWIGPQNLVWSGLIMVALYGVARWLDRKLVPASASRRATHARFGRAATAAGVVGLILIARAPLAVRRSPPPPPADAGTIAQLSATAWDESNFFDDEFDPLPIGPQDFQPSRDAAGVADDLGLSPTDAT